MTSREPHLAELARWAAALRYEDIPEKTRRAARFQLLDMVAAAYAAARSHEVSSIMSGLRGFDGGSGPSARSTVIATGDRVGPVFAAMANAAYSMAQDFDDIVWMGHTCHSAVFAPLAVAEHEGSSARDLVTAIVCANEIGGRLGASSFLGPLNGQMWTFIHLVGAAAGVAKLLGLDAEKTTHALAIALAQPNFALQPGFMAPTSKLLAASTPTATGIQAAYFARAGMTGHPGILEDRRGFWRRFSFLPMPFMLGQLGDFWVLDTLTLKTYPGCHYFQTALTAIERLRSRRPFALEDVRRLTIETTKLGTEVTRFAGDYVGAAGEMTPVRVNFDLAASAAILLTAGRLTVAEIDTEYMRANDAALRAWLQRIEVVHDPALTAKVLGSAKRIAGGKEALRKITLADLARLARRYADEYGSRLFSIADAARFAKSAIRKRGVAIPEAHEAGFPLYFPSRVTFTFADGTRESEQVDLPVGSMAAPHVEAELRAKFAAAVPGEARAFEAGLVIEETGIGAFLAALRR